MDTLIRGAAPQEIGLLLQNERAIDQNVRGGEEGRDTRVWRRSQFPEGETGVDHHRHACALKAVSHRGQRVGLLEGLTPRERGSLLARGLEDSLGGRVGVEHERWPFAENGGGNATGTPPGTAAHPQDRPAPRTQGGASVQNVGEAHLHQGWPLRGMDEPQP